MDVTLQDLERDVHGIIRAFRGGSGRLLHLAVAGFLLDLIGKMAPCGQINANGQWQDSAGNVGATADEVKMAQRMKEKWPELYRDLVRLYPDNDSYSPEEILYIVLDPRAVPPREAGQVT